MQNPPLSSPANNRHVIYYRLLNEQGQEDAAGGNGTLLSWQTLGEMGALATYGNLHINDNANISSAISADSRLTRSSGNTPVSRTAEKKHSW